VVNCHAAKKTNNSCQERKVQVETRNCFSCNKTGHLAQDCPTKKANTEFVGCILSDKPPDAHDKEIIEKSKSEDFELEDKIEWINVSDLIKEIEKEEGKQIAYFDADLVNSEGLIFKIDQDNDKSHQVNMVTTIFYDSYDEEEEKFSKEEGKDTDSEDPEYGNPDLKYMKHRVQQFPRVDK
jgi:Zinc knuckle